MSKSISEWMVEAHELSKSKGWYDGKEERNLGEMLLLLQSEITEAFEEYRSGKGLNEIYYNENNPKPEGFPIELADLFIRAFDLAKYHNIDLEKAIEIKHEYNKTRPYRHGGKKA